MHGRGGHLTPTETVQACGLEIHERRGNREGGQRGKEDGGDREMHIEGFGLLVVKDGKGFTGQGSTVEYVVNEVLVLGLICIWSLMIWRVEC